ncbi:hypothetical protein H104_05776 [Trichophyton rubrum CBS 289.86]|nr:hypothetical protein H104_05776 [Trichophyton rubrum CBS 289.86]
MEIESIRIGQFRPRAYLQASEVESRCVKDSYDRLPRLHLPQRPKLRFSVCKRMAPEQAFALTRTRPTKQTRHNPRIASKEELGIAAVREFIPGLPVCWSTSTRVGQGERRKAPWESVRSAGSDHPPRLPESVLRM